MIDLDDFKRINDQCGHPVGDAVLARLAHALQRRLRPHDVVARLGGDEFALLLLDATAEEAARILARVQQDLERHPEEWEYTPTALRFSAGIAERVVCETLLECLARADHALLDAKRMGKGRLARARPPEARTTDGAMPSTLSSTEFLPAMSKIPSAGHAEP